MVAALKIQLIGLQVFGGLLSGAASGAKPG